jgi:hypothetical protein
MSWLERGVRGLALLFDWWPKFHVFIDKSQSKAQYQNTSNLELVLTI